MQIEPCDHCLPQLLAEDEHYIFVPATAANVCAKLGKVRSQAGGSVSNTTLYGSVLVSKPEGAAKATVEASIAGLTPGTDHSFHFHTYGDVTGYTYGGKAAWGPLYNGPGGAASVRSYRCLSPRPSHAFVNSSHTVS